jgi:hypothetical protein
VSHCGLAVSARLGLLVSSNEEKRTLSLFRLAPGLPLLRSIGGSSTGVTFQRPRGLCLAPWGEGRTVLVADCGGNRVVEVDIVAGVLVDTWFQSPEITLPNCVAACSHTVGVSQTNVTPGSPWFSCISLFDVATRTSRGRVVNTAGPGVDAHTLVFPMQHPLGLRITRDGAHFVVADNERHCIRLFRFADGAISFVQDLGTAEDGIRSPTDVEEVSDGFLVANHVANSLTKINVDGIVSCAGRGRAGWEAMPGYEEYDQPSVLALLPDGGVVVKELGKGGLLRVVPRAVRVPVLCSRALVLACLLLVGVGCQ